MALMIPTSRIRGARCVSSAEEKSGLPLLVVAPVGRSAVVRPARIMLDHADFPVRLESSTLHIFQPLGPIEPRFAHGLLQVGQSDHVPLPDGLIPSAVIYQRNRLSF